MLRSMRFVLVLALACAAVAAASPLGPDGVSGQKHPGRFVWFELATDDPDGARRFYEAVLGWSFRRPEGAPASYAIIESGGRKVGGMFRHSRPAGAPVGSRWLGFISVEDAARAARDVQLRGGEVVAAPRAVSGRGTHAVFRDPQGAVFGVLAASGGDPPDDPVPDGDIFWIDLFAPSPAEAAAFYAAVFGYEVTPTLSEQGRRRWVLATEGIARAGVAALPAGRGAPGWLPYVLVDDVNTVLDRARAAGGKVIVAPRADLLDRNLGVIADPNGGLLGVLNWVTRVEPAR